MKVTAEGAVLRGLAGLDQQVPNVMPFGPGEQRPGREREPVAGAYRFWVATEADDQVDDRDVLLTFHDFPAEHWVHLRTSNPIEPIFATVRHRSDQTRGAVSRETPLSLAFKLITVAEAHWRKLNGFEYLATVITGVRFADGTDVHHDQPARTNPAAAWSIRSVRQICVFLHASWHGVNER